MNIVYIRVNGLINYNTDGFNERNNYIRNCNDINKLRKSTPSNIDNSFAKMKSLERKPDIETSKKELNLNIEEARGNRDNFIIRNNNINNVSNSIRNAMNKNMFKR